MFEFGSTTRDGCPKLSFEITSDFLERKFAQTIIDEVYTRANTGKALLVSKLNIYFREKDKLYVEYPRRAARVLLHTVWILALQRKHFRDKVTATGQQLQKQSTKMDGQLQTTAQLIRQVSHRAGTDARES